MAGAEGSGIGDGVGRKRSSSEPDALDYDFPHIERRLDAALGCLRRSFQEDFAGARRGPMCRGQYGSFLLAHQKALHYEELKRYSMAFAMLEDAKILKNLADRLQNQEANAGQLQPDGALTSLNGASVLEECLAQGERLRDLNQVLHHYREAASTFRSCAITNERDGKPEAAALAYKCLEFTYMRIVSLLSTVSTRRSNQVKILPLGLNFDMFSSPDVTSEGSSEPRHDLRRLASIGEYARCAIDAGQLSHQIFERTALHQPISQECMSSIKKVLQCAHHDTEHFVHLVNLALKEIGI